MVCVPRSQPRIEVWVVAEPPTDTPDTTGLPKSHTVTYSVPKGTDQGDQLVSSALRYNKQTKLKLNYYSINDNGNGLV